MSLSPMITINHNRTIRASDIPPTINPASQFAFLIKGSKPITVKLADDFTNITNAGVYFVVGSANVTIKGSRKEICINATDYPGLIRNGLNGFSWDNLTVKHIKIAANSSGLRSYAAWIVNPCLVPLIGGIANNSQNMVVKNCINHAPLNNANNAGIVYDGTNAKISWCKNTGAMAGEYSSNCAGIVHNGNNCWVSDCVNSGAIAKDNCCGISNYMANSKISCSKNKSSINGQNSGGIAQNIDQTLITRCKNKGNIEGMGCGGIVFNMYNNSQIIRCSNKGKLISNNCGGVCYNIADSEVSNCANYGTILGNNSAGIGASIGISKIIYCKNMGNIEGTNSGGIGHYINNAIITRSVNYGKIVGANSGGIGLYSANNSTVSECANKGHMLAEQCAGIIANGANTRIENCYNTGKLYQNSYGIIGNLTDVTADGIYLDHCYVSSRKISNQDPLTNITGDTIIYREHCSSEKDARGYWSDRRADKYLLGTDGTVWLKNNGKPYKLAQVIRI